MPEILPATLAEREAELLALQSAFDEYIASSRELEEELDAELAKMQEKLAESTAANRALSGQLENIAPQLTSLELALTESRRKLKEEQELRRAAEQAQDEADQRLRELEESLQHAREECDVVHEELAFKESELEESKLELEVEKEQLLKELNEMKENLVNAEARAARATSLMDDEGTAQSDGQARGADSCDASGPSIDDAYVKKLEAELEVVTEQLIESETRLSEAEANIDALKAEIRSIRGQGRSEDDDELIRKLQTEMADRLESEQKLMEDLTTLKEELILAKEEIALQQEELQAAEDENKENRMKLEELMVKHREEVTDLTIQLKEAEVASSQKLSDAAEAAARAHQATDENEYLKEQILSLEIALQNAKADYQNILDELETVNQRFDEATKEARASARDEALEEAKSRMKADIGHEVSTLKEQLMKLKQENRELEKKVEETEMNLARIKDNNEANKIAAESADSEVVKQLKAQLSRAKEEIMKKDEEITVVASKMEERLLKAEEKTTKLEGDLHLAKEKLAESEAKIIVLQREKEHAEHTTHIPESPRRSHRKPKIHGEGFAESEDEEDLDDDEEAELHLLRTPSRDRARSTSPSSVLRLEYKLQEEAKRYADLQSEYNKLQDQKRMADVRVKRLEQDLRVLQKELFATQGDTAVVTQMSRLSSLASTKDKDHLLIGQDEDDTLRVQRIVEGRDIHLITNELNLLQKKVNSQREYNAQLLSKMLHLQGNIQVYCRVRPMTITEIKRGYKEVVESLSEAEVGCFDARTNKWKSFGFDRVWGPDQSQISVFQDVEPLALSVVDGFNACIFAYGQTGSGKTYTMEGVPEENDYGISYRTIQKIFHLLNLRAQQQRAAEMFVESENEDEPAKEVSFKFSLELGMLEIYNDEVYDLLASQGKSLKEKQEESLKAGGKASLEIRRSADGRIEVPNLTKETVNSIEDVMALLKRGNSNRATASTDMNEHSSRSHMVLSVEVKSGLGETFSNKGTLYLVDLAGSERVRKSHVEGEQLKEAGYINKSLSALGNVMEALDRKASHVPYRDSKLTYLLQDSLGGNSRTMMIVTICPHDNSHDESVHALQFATRVRRIQIGAAQRNVTAKNLEETVKALTEDMRALTRAKERSENQLMSLKRDNARVQDKLKNLSKTKVQSKSDSKTLEMLRKNNDDMAARWEKEKNAREEATEELEQTRKEQRELQQHLGKLKSKVNTLERKLEEKENELATTQKMLRNDRNAQNASSVRARRDEVLSARKNLSLPTTPSTTGQSEASTKAIASQAVMSDESSVDEIRSRVLALLEKHDQSKVNRIDIIMEKFRGKEALLLEKMTQRYEGVSSATAFQKRNEIALQRHQERMQKIRENKDKKQAQGSV